MLFVFSLSIGLLIPFSIWAIKTIWWYVFQQAWDLPMDTYGALTITTVVLLLIALVSIIIQPIPKRAGKLLHFALLLMTLTLNLICWLIVWIITNPGFS